jgi:hypothetical protein
MVPERAAALIRSLALVRHPEGGYYREVFRSAREVTAAGGRSRSALTAIYFLLVDGEPSRWHSVGSDEVWHHCEGDPIELFLVDPRDFSPRRLTLGPASGGAQRPVAAVPAGHWQAARTSGAYALAGCVVAPGFDYAEFTLMRDDPAAAERLRAALPDLAALI